MGLTSAQLAVRLLADDDPLVSGWAGRVARRADGREINHDREYERLLRPWIDAGFVEQDGNGWKITVAGLAAVSEALPEPVAAAA